MTVRTKTTRSNVDRLKSELSTLPARSLEELKGYIQGLLQVDRKLRERSNA